MKILAKVGPPFAHRSSKVKPISKIKEAFAVFQDQIEDSFDGIMTNYESWFVYIYIDPITCSQKGEMKWF
jgi:hypothetical protein